MTFTITRKDYCCDKHWSSEWKGWVVRTGSRQQQYCLTNAGYVMTRLVLKSEFFFYIFQGEEEARRRR